MPLTPEQQAKFNRFVDAVGKAAAEAGIGGLAQGEHVFLEPTINKDKTVRYNMPPITIYWLPE